MTINIEELYAQRAEATGVEGKRVAFEFAGITFSFLDPLLLTDEEKDELAELEGDADIAEWYLGEDQYDKLVNTTATVKTPSGKKVEIQGGSNVFFMAFREYQKTSIEQDEQGKFSRQNRSSRRKAARKRAKQH